MKQKLLMMLAALMLMGTSAMAQSETLKGDVNGDGAVDVADIAAEIKVMHDTGWTPTKYYWYVGQENPAELDESFDPETVKITDKTSPGWRYVGLVLPEYSKMNQFWNQDFGNIIINDTKVVMYMAIPSDEIKCRNDISGEDITSDGYIYVELGGKAGIYNASGVEICPPEYDSIERKAGNVMFTYGVTDAVADSQRVRIDEQGNVIYPYAMQQNL